MLEQGGQSKEKPCLNRKTALTPLEEAPHAADGQEEQQECGSVRGYFWGRGQEHPDEQGSKQDGEHSRGAESPEQPEEDAGGHCLDHDRRDSLNYNLSSEQAEQRRHKVERARCVHRPKVSVGDAAVHDDDPADHELAERETPEHSGELDEQADSGDRGGRPAVELWGRFLLSAT